MEPAGDHRIDIDDDPAEHDSQEHEAEALHDIGENIYNEQVADEQIIAQARDLIAQQAVANHEADAAEVEVQVDMQPQPNLNEVLLGERVQQLTDLATRLEALMRTQPADPISLAARRWSTIKYLANGGMKILAFASDVFTVISFINACVDQSTFLRAVYRLRVGQDADSPQQASIRSWVEQDEEAFWKSQAAYYVPDAKASLQAQLNNAQTVIYICGNNAKLCPVIRWESAAKIQFVQALYQTYMDKGAVAMYLYVVQYKHNGSSLPRVAALDCVSLTLTMVIDHILKSKASPSSLDMTALQMDSLAIAHEALPRLGEPIMVFQDAVTPGSEMQLYASSINRARMIARGVSQSGDPTIELVFDQNRANASESALLSRDVASIISSMQVQDVAERARNMCIDLLTQCSDTYPLLQGEHLLTHRIAVLTESFGRALPGSVVYVRSTTRASMMFISYRVRFDVHKAMLEIVHPKFQVITQPFARRPLRLGSDLTDFFKNYIGPIATTLAFTVPPPWGIVAAAGFQLIDEIFGAAFGSKGPDLCSQIQQLLQATVDAIKNLMIDNKIQTITDSVQTFMIWFAEQASALNTLNALDDIYFENTLTTLEGVGSPSNFNNILSDLTQCTMDTTLCNIYHDGVITLAFVAATSYFLSFRLRCQLYSLRAHFAREKLDFANYDRFAEAFYKFTEMYQIALEDWTDKLQAAIIRLTADRVACVQDVSHYSEKHQVCHVTGLGGDVFCGDEDYSGCSFDDTFLPDGQRNVFKGEVTSGGIDDGNADQYRAAADQAHAAYITTLTASLTTRYKPCMDTITEWTDGLTKVKGMMPPQSPQTPPLIDQWLNQPPDPALINQPNSQIQYLVEFMGQHGPSPISESSPLSTIVPGKAPQLTLPVDPHGAALSRVVYRQFLNLATQTLGQRQVADVVLGNVVRVWVDGVKI